MENVFFGVGMNCGDGITPAAAMEPGGKVLAAFAAAGVLGHRLGTVKAMTVTWETAQNDGITASDPSCALNSARNVVEVWKDSENRLFSRAGRIADEKVGRAVRL